MTEHDDDIDDIDDIDDNGGEESFAEMLEKSLAAPARLEPGQKVKATVLKVGDEWVLLDVGQKGEGYLDVKEVLDAEGAPTVKVGDALQTYFLDGEGGELRFTSRIGGGSTGTAQLEEAWKNGIPVEGRLEKEVKGGYEVKLPGGVRAFCPFSQLGLGRQEIPGELVGRTLPFKISQFGERGRNLVVSHRAIVEEERRARRDALRGTLREGMTVPGTVTNVASFGAFVDIGGIEGLVPISQIGWGRTEKVSDVLSVGQAVEVEIKSLDWEKERFSFSLRAASADPWAKVGTVYRQGSTHAGTVARLQQFGAFVTLEPGVDGLLHISKLGEGRRINHPREVLKEGQKVRVTIDEIDTQRRRLSLSLASAGAEADDTASYVNRPSGSMGTFGDLLKAGLEKKKQQ
jgi:small subunit ribosomal protein S1